MDRLKQFAGDKDLMNSVKEYLHAFMVTEVTTKVFNKENIEGYAEAEEIIKSGFRKMIIDYSDKSKVAKDNQAE